MYRDVVGRWGVGEVKGEERGRRRKTTMRYIEALNNVILSRTEIFGNNHVFRIGAEFEVSYFEIRNV